MEKSKNCSRCKTPLPEGRADCYCKPCRAAYHRGWRAGLEQVQERTCEVCGATYTPKQRRNDYDRYCSKQCHWRSRAVRDARLRRRYGISADDYDRILAEQGGGCAFCGKRPEEQTRYDEFLHVDHDHVTGRVRGLLCDQHNLLLGRWGDDPALLRRVVAYLEAHASLI